MRISDWSSDVCSSDLQVIVAHSHKSTGGFSHAARGPSLDHPKRRESIRHIACSPPKRVGILQSDIEPAMRLGRPTLHSNQRFIEIENVVINLAALSEMTVIIRSKERSGGKECVREYRYR